MRCPKCSCCGKARRRRGPSRPDCSCPSAVFASAVVYHIPAPAPAPVRKRGHHFPSVLSNAHRASGLTLRTPGQRRGSSCNGWTTTAARQTTAPRRTGFSCPRTARRRRWCAVPHFFSRVPPRVRSVPCGTKRAKPSPPRPAQVRLSKTDSSRCFRPLSPQAFADIKDGVRITLSSGEESAQECVRRFRANGRIASVRSPCASRPARLTVRPQPCGTARKKIIAVACGGCGSPRQAVCCRLAASQSSIKSAAFVGFSPHQGVCSGDNGYSSALSDTDAGLVRVAMFGARGRRSALPRCSARQGSSIPL